MGRVLVVVSPLVLLLALAAPPTEAERIVAAAESFLGQPYVFGGRAGRRGCRSEGKRVRCREGIDCQSLIFFAYEKVLGTHWTRYSVMPSVAVKRRRLGRPVAGLDGVLRERLDPSALRVGDVLFFLLAEYNLDADPPLWTHDDVRYGVWHTALVHSVGEEVRIIHARPGDRVVIQPLDVIAFDALFVLRRPGVR